MNGMFKIGLLCVIILATVTFFIFDLQSIFSIQGLRSNLTELKTWLDQNPVFAPIAFVLIYMGLIAISFPGATVFTLAAGALFGLAKGAVIVSVASTLGATLAFLIARYIAGKSLQQKYAEKLAKFNAGLEKEGAFYLFALRLVPIFPFFLINILMGLTKIKPLTFLWVSWAGMLPGTIAYVFAGTQLATIQSPKDILSPGLLTAFAILGLLPLLLKWALKTLRVKKGQNHVQM